MNLTGTKKPKQRVLIYILSSYNNDLIFLGVKINKIGTIYIDFTYNNPIKSANQYKSCLL